jgi:predicted histone-like DNA-binding protein
MAIKFKAIARKSPVDKSVSYYPTTESPEPVKLPALVKSIEKITSLSSADVKSCLDALQYEIISRLKDGKSVRFGDLGTFRVSMQGKGTATAEEVQVESIKNLKVVFTPSGQIARSIEVGSPDIAFERVKSIYEAPEA